MSFTTRPSVRVCGSHDADTDTTPRLVSIQAAPRHFATTKLLSFLGDVIINGNPQAKGHEPATPLPPAAPSPAYDHKQGATVRHAPVTLLELGPKKFADWALKQKRLLITDTTFRDAHQSLLATRVRTFDMLAIAGAIAQRTPKLFSLENVGRRHFRHSDAVSPRGSVVAAAFPCANESRKHLRFQMLFRGSNAVGYS